MTPLISAIEDAKSKFLAKFGFPAERLHASMNMERTLTRWFAKNVDPKRLASPTQMEVAGLEVVRMTKRSALLEFYLSATRNGTIYSAQAIIEPETLGFRRVANTNEILIETDDDGAVSDGQG